MATIRMLEVQSLQNVTNLENTYTISLEKGKLLILLIFEKFSKFFP